MRTPRIFHLSFLLRLFLLLPLSREDALDAIHRVYRNGKNPLIG